MDDQFDLTPEEIPGARFNEEEKGKVTVAQLKNYLKCRGINQNGHCKEETVGKVGVHHPASRDRSAVSTTSKTRVFSGSRTRMQAMKNLKKNDTDPERSFTKAKLS